MKHEIIDAPDSAFVRITFETAGETFRAESGAMLARDSGIKMQTAMQGGLLAAAKRKLLGGETVFQNTFTASAPGERLLLAPASEGDVRKHELREGQKLWLSSGAYLASAPSVTLDTKWGGAK